MSANFTRRYNFCGGAQIIPAAPDYNSSYTVTFSAQTAIIESLSGIEHRTGRYYRPLVNQSMSLINLDSETTEYIQALLKGRGNTPIGLPVWMDAVPLLEYFDVNDPNSVYQSDVGDSDDKFWAYQKISAEAHGRLFPWFRYALLWTSAADYEVVSVKQIGFGDSSNTVLLRTNSYKIAVESEMQNFTTDYPYTLTRSHEAGSLLVPLAFGYMKIPEVAYKNGKITRCTVSFSERQGLEPCNFKAVSNACSAYYGHTLLTQYEATKPTETNSSDTLTNTDFPFDNAEWSTSPKSGYVDSQDYEAIDAGVPMPYIAFTDYKNTYRLHFQGDRYTLQKLIRHFENRQGCLYNFKLAINANNDAETQKYVANETNASSRVRYQDDDLKITVIGNNYFKADVGFIKDFLGQGSVPGSTAIRKTYLYRFTKGKEDAEHPLQCTQLYADYGFALELDFLMDGNSRHGTFIGADITHSAIKHSDEMLGEQVEIQIKGFARENLMLENEIPVTVEIYEYNFSNVTSVFRGIIVSREITMGGELTIKASSDLRVLEREMPRFLLQRQCNHTLGDDLCGVCLAGEESIVAIAKVQSVSGNTIGLLIQENPNCEYLPSPRYGGGGSENFFIGATVLGEDGKRYVILDYVENVDNTQIFRLNRPFTSPYNDLGVEDLGTHEVLIYPWCNHSIHHCRYKFDNVARFGGCPWLPSNNTLDNINFNQSVGKK